jgi:hypothetical protein
MPWEDIAALASPAALGALKATAVAAHLRAHAADAARCPNPTCVELLDVAAARRRALAGGDAAAERAAGGALPATCAAEGRTYCLSCSGTEGKAVLAHLSPTELSQVLMRLHPIGASSGPPASLQNELSAIKEEGFAFDDEDYEPGVCCLSVPYFSADGSVAGSVTASVPAMRVARLRSEIRQQLVATAELISRSLA